MLYVLDVRVIDFYAAVHQIGLLWHFLGENRVGRGGRGCACGLREAAATCSTLRAAGSLRLLRSGLSAGSYAGRVSVIAFSDFGDPTFAAEYARRRGDRSKRVACRIVELAEIGEGDSVVDLCCGPGLVAAELMERVGATGEVIGIDASPAMISLARAAAPERNVRFLEGDAYTFSSLLPQPVDHVVATSAWQNFLIDRERILDELARALKPRGRFSFDVRLRSQGATAASSWREIAQTLAARWPELALPEVSAGPARRPYTREALELDLALIAQRGFRLLHREEVEESRDTSRRDQLGWRFDFWLARAAPTLSAQARAEILSEFERTRAPHHGAGAAKRRTTYVVVEAG